MEVVRGFDSLTPAAGPNVVTVGFFDGVHLGHQSVIGRTVTLARERRLPAVGVTFDRHPREVFAPGTEPRQLTSPGRKAELIRALGVDTLARILAEGVEWRANLTAAAVADLDLSIGKRVWVAVKTHAFRRLR